MSIIPHKYIPRVPTGAKSIRPRRVSILAHVNDLDGRYSVAGVVRDQLRLLSAAGHDLQLIVAKNFKEQTIPPGVQCSLVRLPHVDWPQPEAERTLMKFESFKSQAASILVGVLSKYEVCLTHDAMFLPEFLPCNWAIRTASNSLQLRELKWVHWSHSLPGEPPGHNTPYPESGIYTPHPGAEYTTLLDSGRQRVCRRYGVPQWRTHTVHNFLWPDEALGMDELGAWAYNTLRLWEKDMVFVYPARITPSKQHAHLLPLLASMKHDLGLKVMCLLLTAWPEGEEAQKEISGLRAAAKDMDIEECISLSCDWPKEATHDPEWDPKRGVPRDSIHQFYRMSSVFVFPSWCESFGQVVLEAAYAGCGLVLNEDLEACLEFLGQRVDGGQYKRGMGLSFGSHTRPIMSYNPSKEAWYKEKAKWIFDWTQENQVLRGRKQLMNTYNPYWVYENQLLPLVCEVLY